MVRRWKLSAPSPPLIPRKVRVNGDGVHCQWPTLYSTMSMSWNLHKNHSDRDLSASGLVSTLRCWKADTSQLHWDSNFLTLDPSRPCPVYLFIWLVICIFYKNILYNKLTNVSKVFSWALWTVTVNNLTWGRGHGNPWLETKLGRRESNPGTNTPVTTSVWSGGWSCGTQSLAWGLCTTPE